MRFLGDWTNTLIQGIFRYFHKYSFLCAFDVVFSVSIYTVHEALIQTMREICDRDDSIIHERKHNTPSRISICARTIAMESFEQLNIYNQIVVKFGLFKIQAIKIIKTKHNRKYQRVKREGGVQNVGWLFLNLVIFERIL